MANVNPVEGIMYGFRLIGYIIAVFIVGFILLGIGFGISDGGSTILGGLLALVGFLTIFAGFMGVLYKVIADGVEKGINAANAGTGAAAGAGGQPQGGSSRQRQQQSRQRQQRQQGQQ